MDSIKLSRQSQFSKLCQQSPNCFRKHYSMWAAAAAAAKSLQSCPTLCDPVDSSPPGSPIPGILQARTLEWVAISFSNAWKWKVKVKSLGCVRLLATPWTVAHQAPPTMGFSRQECWSGVPLPSSSMWATMNQIQRMEFGKICLKKNCQELFWSQQVKGKRVLIVDK